MRYGARREEWPALSSGYRLEIERMQGEILDYLTRPSGSTEADGKTHFSDLLRVADPGAGLASVAGGWPGSGTLVKRVRDVVRSRRRRTPRLR